MSALQEIMAAMLTYDSLKFGAYLSMLGDKMFRMYSEMGFPPDMFLEEVNKRQVAAGGSPLNQQETIYVVVKYQHAMLDHKRLSGITDERVQKIRRQNLAVIERFISTGELGIY